MRVITAVSKNYDAQVLKWADEVKKVCMLFNFLCEPVKFVLCRESHALRQCLVVAFNQKYHHLTVIVTAQIIPLGIFHFFQNQRNQKLIMIMTTQDVDIVDEDYDDSNGAENHEGNICQQVSQ